MSVAAVHQVSHLDTRRDPNGQPAAHGAQRAKRASTARTPGRAQRGVQRDTSNASAAGQRATAAELRALTALQEVGYRRAGKLGRVKECGTVPIVHGRVALGVTERGGVQCCGLARCGSRWCPHCWGKIAEHRTGEIQQVAEWAEKAGHRLVLATLTAAHVQGEVLDACDGDLRRALMKQDVTAIFDGLAAAWRYVHSGRGGQALKDDRVGYARAFELTCDGLDATQRTGVHGHYHVLLVLDAGADLDRYRERLWERWQAGCARSDLGTDRAGFDWKPLKVGDEANVQAAASYLVKGEKLTSEKIGFELTRSDVKGGCVRTSPEGLLRAIGALDEDAPEMPRAVAQWRGIEDACRNRRWLTWSRDLRELAGLGEELTDEEVAQQDHDVAGGRLLVVRWEDVRDHIEEIRSAVHDARPPERWDVLEMCLAALGVATEETTQDEWRSRVAQYMSDLAAMRRGEA